LVGLTGLQKTLGRENVKVTADAGSRQRETLGYRCSRGWTVLEDVSGDPGAGCGVRDGVRVFHNDIVAEIEGCGKPGRARSATAACRARHT
jgi:hypothetical protein